jgi:hypothetical protein
MQVGSHYAVTPDSFVLTRGGIKKAGELGAEDSLLGLEGGKPSFRELASVSLRKSGRWTRILAHSCEGLVSTKSSVFTIQGPTSVSSLGKGDTLELMNLPSEIKAELEKLPTRIIDDRYRIGLGPSLSYLLGTQLFATRYPDRILIDQTDPSIVRDLAREFSHALNENRIPHKIYFPRYGARIRIDSYRLARLVARFFAIGNQVPLELRLSAPEVMRSFVCGVLDSMISEPDEQGEVRIRTTLPQSEFRRFIFQVLRLNNAKPTYSRVHYPESSLAIVETYFQSSNLERLGLRFFRVKPKKVSEEDYQVFSYSTVIDLNQFRGIVVTLAMRGVAWTLESDLLLVQRLSRETPL